MNAAPIDSTSPTLRVAGPADADALAEQGRVSFVETFGAHYPADDIEAYCRETYGPGVQAREIADPATTLIIAEDEAGIVGHLKLSAMSLPADTAGERPMEVKRLYLLERGKGRGIAEALMKEAIAMARTSGADTLYLSCWTENQRAFRFYGRLGFVTVGRHPFRTGETVDEDFVMRRPI